MKLKNESCFDRAIVAVLTDGILFYDYATVLLSEADLLNSESHGVCLYIGTGFDGRCCFWVENDDAYPIINYDGKFAVVDNDEDYKLLRNSDVITDEENIMFIDGICALNRVFSKMGMLGKDAV